MAHCNLLDGSMMSWPFTPIHMTCQWWETMQNNGLTASPSPSRCMLFMCVCVGGGEGIEILLFKYEMILG